MCIRDSLPDEAVPAGDLEGDPRHLPRLPWRLEGPVDPAHLQHEDPVRAHLNGPAHRDGVHDPAVEVVLAVHAGRRQQAGYGRTRHHGWYDRALREPVLGGPFDAGGAALELNGELGEGQVAEVLFEAVTQWLGRVQVRPRPDGARHLVPRSLAVDLVALADRAPHVQQSVDDRGGGVARDYEAVDGAYGGAEDEVRFQVALEERPEHADLDRPEQSATAEHERGPVCHAQPFTRGRSRARSHLWKLRARRAPSRSPAARPRS